MSKLVAMKVKPSLKKMIGMALIVALICGLVIFASCFNIFIFQKWDYSQWLIIGVFVASTIALFFISINSYHYVINKNTLEVHRFRKIMAYPYEEVIYLDESKGSKNNTITFVMKTGSTIYLIPDKNGLVYQTLVENCQNLQTKEQIKAKFPSIKL